MYLTIFYSKEICDSHFKKVCATTLIKIKTK